MTGALVPFGDQIGFAPSSYKYKEDVHDLGKTSEGL
jgi:hypothetical protein